MAGRKKRLPSDAKVVSLSLGGRERVLLTLIEVERYKSGEVGVTSSAIVSDALSYYFDNVVKTTKEEVVEMIFDRTKETPKDASSNLKQFPKVEAI